MASQQIDDNRRTISSNEAFIATASVVFDGGTANGIGDEDGTGNPHTVFTVTGDVLVTVFGVCKEDLAGASATVEVGTASSSSAFMSAELATNIDEGYGLQYDATPANPLYIDNDAVLLSGDDIILTVAEADVTAGVIDFYCLWRPLSSGASVVAA